MNFGQRTPYEFFGIRMTEVRPGTYMGTRHSHRGSVAATFVKRHSYWYGQVHWVTDGAVSYVTAVGESLWTCGSHLTACVRSRLERVSRLTSSTR